MLATDTLPVLLGEEGVAAGAFLVLLLGKADIVARS